MKLKKPKRKTIKNIVNQIRRIAIFSLIFIWLFTGYPPVLYNSSNWTPDFLSGTFPPKPQIALALTGYLDPNGDGSTGGWGSTGGAHYTEIDDSIRQPTTPTTGDYISGSANTANSIFLDMETISGVQTVSQVTVWIYHNDGSNGQISVQLYDEDESTTRSSEIDLAQSSSNNWDSVTFSSLSITQAQLNTLSVRLRGRKNGSGGPSTITIYSMYADVTYSQNPPTITSVTDSPDPVLANNNVTFSVDWNDVDAGENVKAKICKTDSLTNQNCDGGFWASSTSFTTSDPEDLTYSAQFSDSGSNNYYAFVCDDDGNCSSSTSGTFEVQNVPTISSVIDSPDPVLAGQDIAFSVNWNDYDAGENVKVKICRSDSLSNQNCTAGYWASSTSFTTNDPAAPTYTTQVSDDGANNYWAFVCDDDGNCSISSNGSFTVDAPDTPTITSVTDSPDPVLAGDDITFSVNWNDGDAGENIKTKICKTDSLTNQNCDGGFWASSTSFTTSDPEATAYTALEGDVGTNNYYAFVCDDSGLCSSSTSGTFEVTANNTPVVASVTDSPDPVLVGNILSFSVDWNDPNAGDSIKAKICKTDSLINQNCDGGFWASSTSFTTDDPTAPQYTALVGDVGTNNYYAFVCDDDGNCSTSVSGSFTVETNFTPTITSVTDSPDPVAVGTNISFSVDWNDSNTSETVKVKICKTDSLTNQSCDGGFWASSTAFTADDPTAPEYTAQVADLGSNNYYAFVCDDDGNCSASTSGSFTVEYAPTITSVTDSPDPVLAGNNITFSVDWNDGDAGENVKVKICKTDSLTDQSCDGGFWASSTSFTTNDPEAPTYTALAGDSGTNNYYAFVCDDSGLCSASSSGTFEVRNTPTITSVTDTPDPVGPGNNITFSVDWNDGDADENVKVKICQTNSLTNQNCDGGFWASSSAFTATDPEAPTYTAQVADLGLNSYYAFVCDDDGNCSASTSGSFTVDITTGSTNVLYPIADGGDGHWQNGTVDCTTGDCYTEVDEETGIECSGGTLGGSDSTTYYGFNKTSDLNGERQSFDIDESSIPDESIITQIDVYACWLKEGGGAAGNIYLYYNLNGTPSDGTQDSNSANSVYQEDTHSFTGLSITKSGSTDIEIGTREGDNSQNLRVTEMGTIITYTLPNPTITSVTDSPDPVLAGDDIDFSVDWNDPNSGENIKVKICQTNSLTNQNCDGGTWASSTSFTTNDPETVTYTSQSSDSGSNDYYAFVCDDAGNCSSVSAGTFEVENAPTISSVTDSPDPALAGNNITFSVNWNDLDSGETIKAKICKTDSLTGQNCDGGFWASSTSFTTDDPEALTYTAQPGDGGVNSYYAFVCDEDGRCSASTLGTFEVENAPTITSVTDSPDPVFVGNNITFSVNWNDNDPGETVKVKICKTNSLTNRNCGGGFWASSTSFTASDPEAVTYTALVGDIGVNNYYAFVCDADDYCSASASGTFDVENNAVPEIISVTDSPDPVLDGNNITFSVDWVDANTGESVKVKICKLDSLTNQNCDGGFWASSSAFTTSYPEEPEYTAQTTDSGTNNYYAFVCDDDGNCSDSVSGTFTVVTNNAPTISSVIDTPDPVDPGSNISFSLNWNDVDAGETVKVKICKTDSLSNQNCTGGFWASSTSFTSDDPTAPEYTAQSSDSGTNSYWAFVCDDDGNCSASTAGTFEVRYVPTITAITDTPDPIHADNSITFSIDWNDGDAGDTVKLKICKTDSLTNQNCDGGFWASSTSFTASDPEVLTYTTQEADEGNNSYYAFICDDGGLCSSSTSGTFYVKNITFTQQWYRWYVDNNELNPTDPWPIGGTDLGENAEITSSDDPPAKGDILRLRISLRADTNNMDISSEKFTMQYGERISTCSAITDWKNLGQPASTTAVFRTFDSSVADGTTLTNALISGTDRLGTYQERATTTVSNPVAVSVGEDIEYDWAIQNYSAAAETEYCFRMIREDRVELDTYTYYPALTTSGFKFKTQNWQWFDDETNETPLSSLAAENTAPIEVEPQDIVKLRVTTAEVGGQATTNTKFRLQYSLHSDFSDGGNFVESSQTCIIGSEVPEQVGEGGTDSDFCYADGVDDDDDPITTRVLTDSTSNGVHNEHPTSTSAFDPGADSLVEHEFTLMHVSALSNTTYYFRLYDDTNSKAIDANNGESYPSLVTKGIALAFTIAGLPSGTLTEGVTTDVTTSATGVPFGTLPFSTETEAGQRLTITTTAQNGYRVYVYERDVFAHQDLPTLQIDPVTGTNTVPTGWSTGCSASANSCYGYHAGDDALEGGSSRFAADDTYAQFSSSLEEIAFNSAAVTEESVDIIYKTEIDSMQSGGNYQTSVVYIVVPTF